MAKIAFQGELGAFSEQAGLTYFGHNIDCKPCRNLRDVFQAVEKQATSHGVIPAENSLEGSVNQTYDLLLESPAKICGEVNLRIEHRLLALPGTKLGDLHAVYSHPQALAQCSDFLESVEVDSMPSYDTAGSAKMIKEKQLRDAGAIASERAAQLYGLETIRTKISNFPTNFTRFFIISQDDAAPTGRDKTSIAFGTDHSPGALHRALSALALRKINLTKIESRPTRTTPWEYHFFVDFEGHRSDPAGSEALEALKDSVTFLKILGSYPQAQGSTAPKNSP